MNESNARRLTKLLGLSIALLATTILASCSKETHYSIGTGSRNGIYSDTGQALAHMVNDQESINGFRIRNELSTGSAANINAVLKGDIQFGIAQADDQYFASRGEEEWAGSGPQNQLRSVFSVYEEAVTLVAGADTAIRNISDMKDKTVDIGPPGSGTRQNAIEALEAVGIDWQKDIVAVDGNMDDRLAKFMKGELDAFFFTAGHPNTEVRFATFSVRSARIVALSNINSIIGERPYYTEVHIPNELYPRVENTEAVRTFGVRATIVTSASVPDDVVYAVTKAVFERDKKYESLYSELSAMADGKILDGLSAPIHPGALRYFKEAGIDVPARLLVVAQ